MLTQYSGSTELIEDSEKTNLVLTKGINLIFDEVLYYNESQKNLLSSGTFVKMAIILRLQITKRRNIFILIQ